MDPTRNSSPGARLVKTEATPTPADHPSSSTTTKTQSSATTPSDAKKKSSTAAATAAKKPPAGKKPKTLSSAAAAASLPSLKKGGPREAKRLAKAVVNGSPDTAMDDDGSDESDNGPYCLCRGPDDHRWMICCERCDDWFHGECIDLDKGIGESLIEKFVCPNCTTDVVSTIYKKTCALPACRKPARIALGGGTNIPETSSVFCSNDHAHAWWERLVARMPRDRAAAGLSDQLTQDEFMALVASGLAAVGSDGLLKLARMPFQDDDTTALPEVDGGMSPPYYVYSTANVCICTDPPPQTS